MDLLKERSVLTHHVFRENEELLNKYIRPLIKNPALLTPTLVDALMEEIPIISSFSSPDYEVADSVLSMLLDYMRAHDYPIYVQQGIESRMTLCKIKERPYLRNIGSFQELDRILYYISDSMGTEAVIHTQNIVLMLTVKHQLHTFIHSVMVSQLATLVAQKIMQKDPGFFSSTGSTQADVLGFINTAALLHDIGKTDIAHIINQQSRSLTPEELRIIRTHPDAGGDLLERIPVLKPFADIARGHHCYYDGNGGYPDTFDNTSSPYKQIIDLISVCDSIDAATDTVGRCYTANKKLQTVLAELEAGSGTRYSPEIVIAITSDSSLIEMIESTVTVGRDNTYYRVYKDYTRKACQKAS